jgi:cysteine synthase A
VAKDLKKRNPEIKIIAVEPEKSAVISGGKPGPHMIQGIGAGFVPKVFDLSVVDEVIPVSDADAFAMTKDLLSKEGIICGISSGAAAHAALKVAARAESTGKLIVVILPDTGERYLSTTLFEN